MKGLWEKGEKPQCRGKMESDLVAGGGGYQGAGGQVGGQGAEGQSRSSTASNAEIAWRHGKGAETPGKKGHDFSDAKAVQSRKPKKLLTKDKNFHCLLSQWVSTLSILIWKHRDRSVCCG